MSAKTVLVAVGTLVAILAPAVVDAQVSGFGSVHQGGLRFNLPGNWQPPPRQHDPDAFGMPAYQPKTGIVIIPNRVRIPEPVTATGTYEYLVAEATNEDSKVFKDYRVREAVMEELSAYRPRPGATFEVIVTVDVGDRGFEMKASVRALDDSDRR
jgi:hypothetical protein